MQCNCGNDAKAVSVICGIVKVSTYHCVCGKTGHKYEFVASYTKHGLVELLERMRRAHLKNRSEIRRLAIDFIERTLDALPYDKEANKTQRQKKNDLWERQYLKELLGEDYYL